MQFFCLICILSFLAVYCLLCSVLFKLCKPVSLSPAILVYRVFRNESKKNVKLLHSIIHLLALIMSIIGEKERNVQM